MKDPHGVTLVYRIEHGNSFGYSRSFDYSNAQPFCYENQAFRRSTEDKEVRFDLSVKDKKVHFELHGHYPTVGKAREALDEYLRLWQIYAELKQGPNSFRLVFEYGKLKTVDRNSTPEHEEIDVMSCRVPYDSCDFVEGVDEYPAPPSGMALTPDIETMHYRYMLYKSDREPLPSMAYFCLTVVEGLERTNSDGKEKGKRKAAAEKLRIDLKVLEKIGQLSSELGGIEARKREGKEQKLSDKECNFLEGAVQVLIRRAAEYEHWRKWGSQEEPLEIISLSNPPPLDGEDQSGSKTQEKT